MDTRKDGEPSAPLMANGTGGGWGRPSDSLHVQLCLLPRRSVRSDMAPMCQFWRALIGWKALHPSTSSTLISTHLAGQHTVRETRADSHALSGVPPPPPPAESPPRCGRTNGANVRYQRDESWGCGWPGRTSCALLRFHVRDSIPVVRACVRLLGCSRVDLPWLVRFLALSL